MGGGDFYPEFTLPHFYSLPSSWESAVNAEEIKANYDNVGVTNGNAVATEAVASEAVLRSSETNGQNNAVDNGKAPVLEVADTEEAISQSKIDDAEGVPVLHAGQSLSATDNILQSKPAVIASELEPCVKAADNGLKESNPNEEAEPPQTDCVEKVSTESEQALEAKLGCDYPCECVNCECPADPLTVTAIPSVGTKATVSVDVTSSEPELASSNAEDKPAAVENLESLPVEENSANDSQTMVLKEKKAVKIQSVYRGHVTRAAEPLKQLKTIKSVNAELAPLEEKIKDGEKLRILLCDKSERFKVNEGLMALLLRLDSVQSGIEAVREIRKSPSKRIIALMDELEEKVTAFNKLPEELRPKPTPPKTAPILPETVISEAQKSNENTEDLKKSDSPKGSEQMEPLRTPETVVEHWNDFAEQKGTKPISVLKEETPQLKSPLKKKEGVENKPTAGNTPAKSEVGSESSSNSELMQALLQLSYENRLLKSLLEQEILQKQSLEKKFRKVISRMQFLDSQLHEDDEEGPDEMPPVSWRTFGPKYRSKVRDCRGFESRPEVMPVFYAL